MASATAASSRAAAPPPVRASPEAAETPGAPRCRRRAHQGSLKQTTGSLRLDNVSCPAGRPQVTPAPPDAASTASARPRLQAHTQSARSVPAARSSGPARSSAQRQVPSRIRRQGLRRQQRPPERGQRQMIPSITTHLPSSVCAKGRSLRKILLVFPLGVLYCFIENIQRKCGP